MSTADATASMSRDTSRSASARKGWGLTKAEVGPTWQWLVGIMFAGLVALTGILYGTMATRLDDHEKQIVSIGQRLVQTETHFQYVREELVAIRSLLERTNGR